MPDPLIKLADDRRQARESDDPCAGLCTLASLNDAGWPDARTLVLRDVDGRLAVFVNATSPKFAHLDRVSVVVWLPTINVQYRLRCTTSPVPGRLVAESWQLRPEPPKRMDWLYTLQQGQSTAIASRDALLDTLAGLALPDPLVAPETARGLFLNPEQIDRLDLGMDNGVHDRRRYLPGNPGGWIEEVLVP
jgi:pyridoxamine 5'-phosphate oxidase